MPLPAALCVYTHLPHSLPPPPLPHFFRYLSLTTPGQHQDEHRGQVILPLDFFHHHLGRFFSLGRVEVIEKA